jgi:hypothetical protein
VGKPLREVGVIENLSGHHRLPSKSENHDPAAPAAADLNELEHLLKVAALVAQDANNAWARMWGEFKPHVTSGGVISPELKKGFVPQCGWDEFFENIWLLKHYLDSIQRIGSAKHHQP